MTEQQQAGGDLFTAAVPWGRQAVAPEQKTARTRQMVQGLPEWEPLPPGEIIVQRHRRD
jgi:hypothetical protein